MTVRALERARRELKKKGPRRSNDFESLVTTTATIVTMRSNSPIQTKPRPRRRKILQALFLAEVSDDSVSEASEKSDFTN